MTTNQNQFHKPMGERPDISQGNYLIKHQHIFAYASAHAAYISVSKSLDQALYHTDTNNKMERVCDIKPFFFQVMFLTAESCDLRH